MDLLIILSYVAFAYGCFKIFKIPVNKWTVPTAALGGVFVVAGLILTMNYITTLTPSWPRRRLFRSR